MCIRDSLGFIPGFFIWNTIGAGVNTFIKESDKFSIFNLILSKEAKNLNIKRFKRSILKKKLFDQESFNHFLDAYEAHSRD